MAPKLDSQNQGAQFQSFGYWIELEGLQFEEDGTSQWIHAMPLGEWSHPIYGKMSFTLDKVQRLSANVNARVRGQDLDIDYDHKSYHGEAAGWVRRAETRSNGLWLFVEWTKTAAAKIKEKAYKYFSPEFKDVWEHPQTGQKIRDVLFGGGITNRPYLKDMVPLNLSELTKTGGDMNRAFLETTAKGLGVTFDDKTTDEALQQLITEAAVKASDSDASADADGSEGGSGDENAPPAPPPAPPTEPPAPEPELVSVLSEGELKKLAESNPVVKLLLDERETNSKRLAALETSNRLAETELRLGRLIDGNKRLAPAAHKQLSELCAGVPKEVEDRVIAFAEQVLKGGAVVELGEAGRTDASGGDGDVASRFENEVKKLLSENKDMTYADAVERVGAEQPALYDQYREQSFSFKE